MSTYSNFEEIQDQEVRHVLQEELAQIDKLQKLKQQARNYELMRIVALSIAGILFGVFLGLWLIGQF